MFSSLDYTECLISSCWLPVKSQDTINKKDKKKKKKTTIQSCVSKKKKLHIQNQCLLKL